MMKSLKTFLLTLLLWTLTGTLGHVLFLLLYSGLMAGTAWSERLMAPLQALKLDVAVGAYLTVIPGLLLAIGAGGRWMKALWSAYFALFGAVYALATVANLGLYGPWGFPLDYTPVLYLKTSPAEAFASASFWQMSAAAATMFLLAWGVWRLRPRYEASPGWGGRLVLLLLTGALVLPMRGGLSTGTNHTGTVYFSENIRLNHAAVNPVFSFIESATHQEDLSSQYRFMSDEEAELLVDNLNHETDTTFMLCDSLFTAKPERIVLIILESFSTQLMEEAGLVRGTVPQLERLASEAHRPCSGQRLERHPRISHLLADGPAPQDGDATLAGFGPEAGGLQHPILLRRRHKLQQHALVSGSGGISEHRLGERFPGCAAYREMGCGRRACVRPRG